MNSHIVALLPMRGESRRVSNKNTRFFAGRPLYHHILETLLRCPEIDSVYINTDSEFIAEEASRVFKRVHIIQRPEHLRSELTSMNDILLHDINQVHADLYVQTHSTNPLLKATTISQAIATLRASPKHDSLFAVTPLYTRLWWPDGTAINHDPELLMRTQDLLPVYVENSNLYIFRRPTLQERRNRIGYQPLLFEIDRRESWDIDDWLDFQIAEFLYREEHSSNE